MLNVSRVGWLAISLVVLGILLVPLAFWVPNTFFNTRGAIPESAGAMYIMVIGGVFCIAVGFPLLILDRLPFRSLLPPILVLFAGVALMLDRSDVCGLFPYYDYCHEVIGPGALAVTLVGGVFLVQVIQRRRRVPPTQHP